MKLFDPKTVVMVFTVQYNFDCFEFY